MQFAATPHYRGVALSPYSAPFAQCLCSLLPVKLLWHD